jgi:peptidoglycan/xylan/chitin deacetylase (PgdA/CDA1 family)
VTNFRPAGAKDLDEAAQFANGFWTEKEAFSQDWNSELFFWRFFHPRGPRHVMTVLRRAEKIVAFAVTSLGVRKGVRLARIVDWRASSIFDLTILLRQVVRELRKAGGHLAVVSSGESGHNDLLKGTAWSVWGRAPESFFLHRRCKEPLPHAFMASAGDFGFDAFETGGGTRMNTTGTFMISFDCEGKWGRADFLTPALENTLTSAAIEAACGQILASFRGHRLKGTFAFVGAFTLTPDEYHEISERLPDVVIDGKPWLGAFRAAGARRTFDGWLVPEARLRVQAEGVHEIATHGFTHLPLGESVVTPEVFDRELELAREESARQGWTARTLIYPRNHVGYTERLERHGVIGYRELLWPTWRGAARKLRSLAAEFGFGGRSQEQTVPSNPVEIPSGYLLNFWHNRSRRWISREATRRRWRTIMADAARVGGCVHLWSHPENFVADPGLIEVFDDILADAASFVRAGQLKNVTQEEYCLARLQEQKSFKTVVA